MKILDNVLAPSGVATIRGASKRPGHIKYRAHSTNRFPDLRPAAHLGIVTSFIVRGCREDMDIK